MTHLKNRERQNRKLKHKEELTKNLVTEWDDTFWAVFLDRAIVNTDGPIEFCFKDGSKIPV